MKIAEELRPDGSTRYRVQHKDLLRPGRYTTRRFDDKGDAADFVRRAKNELASAIAWDEERRGGVSFRGQAGKTFAVYAQAYIDAQTDSKAESRAKLESRLRTIERVPAFALLRMGEITTTDVENLKKALTALSSSRGGVLKSRSKNSILALVSSVIRRAAFVGDIPRDVAIGVPKFRIDDAKKTCPITVPEFDSILVHIAEEKRPLFRLLLDSGLRISEALSLEWREIRPVGQGIYEISVYGEDASGGKTENAQRITTIPAETFKTLAVVDEERVFLDTYPQVSVAWARAVFRAQSSVHAKEFPVLTKSPTIHDLRHSHASFLITSAGMNLALVAERLGHKDIRVTQKYYGRLVTEQAHELGVVIARNIPRGVVQ